MRPAPSTDKHAARRVLIYRLGSLGDTIVALPALHLAARSFPGAEFRLLTNFPIVAKAAPGEAILSGSGLIDGVFHYPVGTRNPFQLAALVWRLRCWSPDVVIYLAARGSARLRRDTLFFRLCGVRRIIGLPLTPALQNNFYGAETAPAGADTGLVQLEPEFSRIARTLAELGEARLGDAASWDLHLSSAEHARAADALGPLAGKPLLAVSLGTKMQANDWGLANWQSLLARLAPTLPGFGLLLLGAAEEAAASETAAAAWTIAGGGPVAVLCGRLSPRESAAALIHATLYAGHDSGPLHLAASVGIACVGIFASRNLPGIWFPRGDRNRILYHPVDCMGCGLETCTVQRKKCILSITVDEAEAAIHDVLRSTRGSTGRKAP